MTLAINPRRLEQPAHEPLSLAEVKLFLRIEHDAENVLATLMQAARESTAERLLNISCITQTWHYVTARCASGMMPLPYGPVTSISLVEMREPRTMRGRCLIPAIISCVMGRCITANAFADMRITYVAGISNDAEHIPADIRYALLQHIAVLYEARGSTAVVQVGHIYAALREVRV